MSKATLPLRVPSVERLTTVAPELLRPDQRSLTELGHLVWRQFELLAATTLEFSAPDELARLASRDAAWRALLAEAALLQALDQGLLPGRPTGGPQLRARLRDRLAGLLESASRALAVGLLSSRDLARGPSETSEVYGVLNYYSRDADPRVRAAADEALRLIDSGQSGPSLVEVRPCARPAPAPGRDPVEVLYTELCTWMVNRPGPPAPTALGEQLMPLAQLLSALNQTCQADGSVRGHRYFVVLPMERLFEACERHFGGELVDLQCRVYHLRPFEECGIWRLKNTSSVAQQRVPSRFFEALVECAERGTLAHCCVCQLATLAGLPPEHFEKELSVFRPTQPVTPDDLRLFEPDRLRFRRL